MTASLYLLRRATPAFGALAGLLTLAGCMLTPGQEAPLPAKNRAQWTTALDSYVPQKLVAASYGETLLDGQCMQAAGFANWAVPWRETNPDPGPSWNAAGVRLFRFDLASRYGYHAAPAVRSDTGPAWEQFLQRVNTNTTDAEDAAFLTCRDAVRAENPLIAPDAAAMNLALGYLSQASDLAHEAKPVRDAAANWRTCMEPEGISDLPQTPQQMPPKSLRDAFRLGGTVDGPADHSDAVTADEIRLASVDARCAETSGYQQRLYDAVWDESSKLFRENFDALERAKAKLKKQDHAAQDVINSYAPARATE